MGRDPKASSSWGTRTPFCCDFTGNQRENRQDPYGWHVYCLTVHFWGGCKGETILNHPGPNKRLPHMNHHLLLWPIGSFPNTLFPCEPASFEENTRTLYGTCVRCHVRTRLSRLPRGALAREAGSGSYEKSGGHVP